VRLLSRSVLPMQGRPCRCRWCCV